jgi:hypothetical protein
MTFGRFAAGSSAGAVAEGEASLPAVSEAVPVSGSVPFSWAELGPRMPRPANAMTAHTASTRAIRRGRDTRPRVPAGRGRSGIESQPSSSVTSRAQPQLKVTPAPPWP